MPPTVDERFILILQFTLSNEIEYNKDGTVKTEYDPHDPGGATRYGIDQRSFNDQRKDGTLSGFDGVAISDLTLVQATEVYQQAYWDLNRCSLLPFPVGEAVFDAAVNCGSGKSVRWLQRCTGAPVDGITGPVTVTRTLALNPFAVTEALLERRTAFYLSLQNRRFEKGWLARVSSLRAWIKNNTPSPS